MTQSRFAELPTETRRRSNFRCVAWAGISMVLWVRRARFSIAAGAAAQFENMVGHALVAEDSRRFAAAAMMRPAGYNLVALRQRDGDRLVQAARVGELAVGDRDGIDVGRPARAFNARLRELKRSKIGDGPRVGIHQALVAVPVGPVGPARFRGSVGDVIEVRLRPRRLPLSDPGERIAGGGPGAEVRRRRPLESRAGLPWQPAEDRPDVEVLPDVTVVAGQVEDRMQRRQFLAVIEEAIVRPRNRPPPGDDHIESAAAASCFVVGIAKGDVVPDGGPVADRHAQAMLLLVLVHGKPRLIEVVGIEISDLVDVDL